MRTVIWDFAGEAIPPALLKDIGPLAEAVPSEVAELLDGGEVAAVQRLLRDGALPAGPTGTRYSWPLVWLTTGQRFRRV